MVCKDNNFPRKRVAFSESFCNFAIGTANIDKQITITPKGKGPQAKTIPKRPCKNAPAERTPLQAPLTARLHNP